MKRIWFGSLAAIVVATATAQAPLGDGILKETIQFSDLNLSSPSGIDVLYRRIKVASEHVCEEYHDGSEKNLTRWGQIRQCKATAMKEAVLKVNNASLTSYYQDKVGVHVDGASPKIAVTLK